MCGTSILLVVFIMHGPFGCAQDERAARASYTHPAPSPGALRARKERGER